VQAVTSTALDPAELLHRLRARTARTSESPITHIERVPAREGRPVDWPAWVSPTLIGALGGQGISQPWSHQAAAASLANSGTHVVLATGTASGKSLGYQLPVLTRLLSDERATALYISPAKALAADQLRAVARLGLDGVRPATYDGDTAREERDWVRQNSRLIFTNPDMVHHSLLPGHQRWAQFLRRLSYVVIDECHAYRGVFGSHVAHVVRRLRRAAARYGGSPTFVLASATSGDPGLTASRLVGLPVEAVTDDGSPRGAVTFALWEPPLLPDTSPDGDDLIQVRRSALSETADLLTDSVIAGTRTLAFIRSRRGAEVVASIARRSLNDAVPGLGSRVAAYRAGYLRDDRRAIERRLLSGDLLALASTNALELGVDLVGLDAVLICGYPGTRASLWQQAGRAGRAGGEALAVLVARDDPLDTYLVHHPSALFGRPVEATVLDPANPYVLGPQLCCAASEAPITLADLPLFGGDAAQAALDGLAASGALRKRPSGWYWTHRGRPEVDLRGTGSGPVQVVEEPTGRLLGTVDPESSHSMLHTGAVYLHQGVTYVVDDLDLEDAIALVHPEEPDWTTQARDVIDLSVVSVRSYVDAGPVGLFLGEVDVTSQVVSYQRRRIATGELIDTRPLELPARELRTVAVWFTVSPRALEAAGISPADFPGALHAAEHAGIGLLPLIATCDRWDIGGLSTANHVDTQAPTVFVYDGHPGGAGFAERAYEAATEWLRATRVAIASCVCESGCPSCVQSPKCGNGNNPLHKPGAIRVLDVVLQALAAVPPHPSASAPPQSSASAPPQPSASVPPQSSASAPPQPSASVPPQSGGSVPPQSGRA
jgi:DEAD/DEAH box helicase domain-containing protein